MNNIRTVFPSGVEFPIRRAENKNRLKHHQDTQLFHGPIAVPDDMLARASTSPVYLTSGRKCVIRFQTLSGVTWIFREYTANHRVYVGEVVRTLKGQYRVHLWRAAKRAGVDPLAVIERDSGRVNEHTP